MATHEVIKATAEKFQVLARGAGGIEELSSELPEDDASVVWGLVTCIIGSGTFARTKYVKVNLSGANCAPIRRMKANEFKLEAGMVLGEDCVDYTADKRADVYMDPMVEKLLRVCCSDNATANVTASSIKRDLEEQARRAMMALRERRESSVCEYTGPRTIVAMGKKISLPQVLQYVQSPKGPLNWVLIDSSMKLIEAGGGSVAEMSQFFDPKEVSFGLLRMGFGSGQFKRNYWLFIHWAGEKAAATVRGKANAEKDKCKEKLKPSQIDFFASDHSEISVQIIIDKVVMYCSVDGDTKGDKSPFSLAAFNEALLEDMKMLENEFGLAEMAKPERDDDPNSLNVLDAVRGVRDPNNPYNWLLIQQIVNAKPGVAAVGKMSLLKKVGVPADRSSSAASPFGDFKLKKSAHPAVMADIAQGSSGTSLKKAETNDKSAPVIDSTVTIGKNKRGELMEAIANKA